MKTWLVLVAVTVLAWGSSARANEADDAEKWMAQKHAAEALKAAVDQYSAALVKLGADSEGKALEGSADPATMLHDDVARVRSTGTKLMTLDPSKVSIEGINALDRATEAVLARELTCRASAPCMAPRLSAVVCGLIAERKTYVDAIAAEKANPSGVVDLRALYDLGASVQFADKRIAEAKAEYARVVKRPFAASSCR